MHPKAETKGPKVVKVRPDVAHNAPSSEKYFLKRASKQRRTMKNVCFPKGFCMFRCKPTAYGIWPLAVDFWLSAKHFGGPESSYPVVRWKGSMTEPLGAKWPPKAAKEDPKADTERPKVAKVRPDVDHKAPSIEKSRKKLSEAWPRAAQNHEI